MSMLMSNSLGIPVSRFGGSSFLGTLMPLLLSVDVVVVASDLSMSSSFFIVVRASSSSAAPDPPDPPPPPALALALLLWRRRRRRPPRSRADVGVVVEHEQNRDDALRIIGSSRLRVLRVRVLSICVYVCIVKERACVCCFFSREFVSLGGDIRFDFFFSGALAFARSHVYSRFVWIQNAAEE